MFRRLAGMSGFIFTIVILWKFILLITTAQPIPFSDAFFYDGPVVNLLNGGNYANPSIGLFLPISGTKVFSSYPPLYQFTLWLWMTIFGTSAMSATWLHLVLFGIYGLGMIATLRLLKIPPFYINFGCLFMFGITYHDRPDSLAFALGTWAMFSWLRALEKPAPIPLTRWHWFAATLNVLTFVTSLQLGMMYFGCSVLLVLLTCGFRRQPFPWLAIFVTAAIPVILVLYVKTMQPLLWAGFQEHVRETPSLLGLQATNFWAQELAQIFKLGRYALGIFASVLIIGILLVRVRFQCRDWFIKSSHFAFLMTSLVAASLVIIAATAFLMFIIHWLGYLQIAIVACTLYLLELHGPASYPKRTIWIGFLGMALIVGSRAIGMSTWGVANAYDVSYSQGIQRVHTALDGRKPGDTVVLSSAFLYEASKFQNLRLLHTDWLASYRQPYDRGQVLIDLKPQMLVASQFDWYRWHQPVITELAKHKELVEIVVKDEIRIRPCDAYPKFQKVLQHTSWSPVIVEFQWKTNTLSVRK